MGWAPDGHRGGLESHGNMGKTYGRPMEDLWRYGKPMENFGKTGIHQESSLQKSSVRGFAAKIMEVDGRISKCCGRWKPYENDDLGNRRWGFVMGFIAKLVQMTPMIRVHTYHIMVI